MSLLVSFQDFHEPNSSNDKQIKLQAKAIKSYLFGKVFDRNQ
jgi:hypothetical protein